MSCLSYVSTRFNAEHIIPTANFSFVSPFVVTTSVIIVVSVVPTVSAMSVSAVSAVSAVSVVPVVAIVAVAVAVVVGDQHDEDQDYQHHQSCRYGYSDHQQHATATIHIATVVLLEE